MRWRPSRHGVRCKGGQVVQLVAYSCISGLSAVAAEETCLTANLRGGRRGRSAHERGGVAQAPDDLVRGPDRLRARGVTQVGADLIHQLGACSALVFGREAEAKARSADNAPKLRGQDVRAVRGQRRARDDGRVAGDGGGAALREGQPVKVRSAWERALVVRLRGVLDGFRREDGAAWNIFIIIAVGEGVECRK
jgi:hypothetical protein